MVQVCEDFESLRNLLFDLLDSDNNYVYRGYSSQKELLPNIIRFKDNTKNEIKILEEFEKYSGSYYNANNALDFLSYAQHFGLPTRLLDFSYNPFVALFFALNSPKKESYENEEDKDFYYICYVDLDKHNKINEISQYGMKLLKSGMSLEDMSLEDVIYRDFKSYTVNDYRFGVGQVLTVDFNDFEINKYDYVKILNDISRNNEYKLCALFVTNILTKESYVLFNDDGIYILKDAFDTLVYQGVKLNGILSRKKQIVPNIMEVMERL